MLTLMQNISHLLHVVRTSLHEKSFNLHAGSIVVGNDAVHAIHCLLHLLDTMFVSKLTYYVRQIAVDRHCCCSVRLWHSEGTRARSRV